MADHDPPVGVQLIIAGEGRDFYPDEMDAAANSSFVAAAFATTPGIGGVRLVYGESCFAAKFVVAAEEIDRMAAKKAPPPARRVRAQAPSPFRDAPESPLLQRHRIAKAGIKKPVGPPNSGGHKP